MILSAKVSGRVQGVFFRVSTRNKAQQLRLTGWVRNNWDGTVEVLAEGPKNVLKIFVKWLHHGPPYAIVHEVKYQIGEGNSQYSSFSVTR
ncbi:MAG: acylphosphatase [Promethearchaeota archaeon]